MEKPIDFWLRKGKTGGEPKSTEIKGRPLSDLCEPIAERDMAKVEWSAGIDSVSGALAKPTKSGHHSCEKMLLGTHRVAETTNNVCNRLYIRKKVKRSTPVSADEIEIRSLFSRRQAWVVARSKSLTTLTQDQLAYQAQKDEPGGIQTWKAYLWSLAKEAITLGGN